MNLYEITCHVDEPPPYNGSVFLVLASNSEDALAHVFKTAALNETWEVQLAATNVTDGLIYEYALPES